MLVKFHNTYYTLLLIQLCERCSFVKPTQIFNHKLQDSEIHCEKMLLLKPRITMSACVVLVKNLKLIYKTLKIFYLLDS